MTYEAKWYQSPLSLPEQKRGKISIKHKRYRAGDRVDVISAREAWCTGTRAKYAKLSAPLIIHQLCDEKNGVWMTDEPCELNQMARAIHETAPYGHVLIGGLGLGILANWVRVVPEVEEVVVVERNPDVIALIRPTLLPGVKVVRDDTERYLRNMKLLFDCYMLDTWQGTRETDWWATVLPLRRIIGRKHGALNSLMLPTIYCWAEDIMLGQVKTAMRAHYEAGKRKHWYYRDLELPPPAEQEWFFKEIGTSQWEKRFGKQLSKA